MMIKVYDIASFVSFRSKIPAGAESKVTATIGLALSPDPWTPKVSFRILFIGFKLTQPHTLRVYLIFSS